MVDLVRNGHLVISQTDLVQMQYGSFFMGFLLWIIDDENRDHIDRFVDEMAYRRLRRDGSRQSLRHIFSSLKVRNECCDDIFTKTYRDRSRAYGRKMFDPFTRRPTDKLAEDQWLILEMYDDVSNKVVVLETTMSQVLFFRFLTSFEMYDEQYMPDPCEKPSKKYCPFSVGI